MDVLRCVLCELDEFNPEPILRHQHLNGQIPLTPCRPCWVGNHEACNPLAPYWCTCTHKQCRNRMTKGA